jgi:arylsulfatase A-like enzyme
MRNIIAAIVFGTICLCGIEGYSKENVKKKPNILFYFADDWGKYAGVYKDANKPSVNDIIKTPVIDRIAREGMIFDNGYMPVSQCAPCRASLATGSYFWRCGSDAFLQSPEFEKYNPPNPLDNLPLFTQLLEDNGYLIAASWKTFKRNMYSKKYHGISAEGAFKRSSLYAYQSDDPKERKERVKHIEIQARECMKKVLGLKKTGQPFYYAYGPINTHRPWIKGSGRELWDINPDDLKGKLPAYLPDVPDVREDFADYLGEVQAHDLMLNALLEVLEEAGELENTLVILTGDNGIPGFPRGKTQLYDIGVEAPLIAWWAGHIKPGRRVDDFVNIMDLSATFLEAGGCEVPKTMDSKSLMPQLLADKSGQIDPSRDYVVVGRERHVANAREGNMPYPARAVHTKDFIYIRNFKPDRWPMGDPDLGLKDCDGSPTKSWILDNIEGSNGKFYEMGFGKRPAEELYDQRNDPDQMNNLAGNPDYKKVQNKLAKQLNKVQKRTEDPRLTDAFDRLPYTDSKLIVKKRGKGKK